MGGETAPDHSTRAPVAAGMDRAGSLSEKLGTYCARSTAASFGDRAIHMKTTMLASRSKQNRRERFCAPATTRRGAAMRPAISARCATRSLRREFIGQALGRRRIVRECPAQTLAEIRPQTCPCGARASRAHGMISRPARLQPRIASQALECVAPLLRTELAVDQCRQRGVIVACRWVVIRHHFPPFHPARDAASGRWSRAPEIYANARSRSGNPSPPRSPRRRVPRARAA